VPCRGPAKAAVANARIRAVARRAVVLMGSLQCSPS
jgi:hypothetical protein